jgi:hypothetical protein
VDDVHLGVVTKGDGLNRLKPSAAGDQTLFDEMAKLRTLIVNDGVLTELEVRTHVAALRATVMAAVKAINEQSVTVFQESVADVRESLLTDRGQGGPAADAFRTAFWRTCRNGRRVTKRPPVRSRCGTCGCCPRSSMH